MLSIVVVYNDERALNEILLDGLKNQTVKYDLIALDNTKGSFKSAAEALNSGANKAKGKYIMFIHQDVELGSDSWLEDVEKVLDDIPDI
ncbi:MAG: glycosyltransferase, partial [Planctomycetota bacterium]